MKRYRPIAISACLAVMIMTGFATRWWVACVIEVILLIIISYCWIQFGIRRPWRTKEIRHKHTYVYYGCADHQKLNLHRLLLGELRIKYISGDYLDGAELERQYRGGMFRIDVITDELVVGAEYLGEISISEEESTIHITTLKRVTSR